MNTIFEMTPSFSSVAAESAGLPVDFGASSDLDLDPDHLLVSFEDPTHHNEVQPPSKNQYLTDHFNGCFQGHYLPTGGMNEISPACTCRNTNATIRRVNDNNHTIRQSGHRKSLLPTAVPQMIASHENLPCLRPIVGIGYSTGIPSLTPPSTLVSNPGHPYQCGDSYQPGSGYIDSELDPPRIFQCKWEGCPYRGNFTKLPTLWRHIQSTHISPDEYNCTECGKTFGLGRGDKFKVHMKVAHSESRLARDGKDNRFCPF